MRSKRWWILAALPFALVACGGDETDEVIEDPVVETDPAVVAPMPAATDTMMTGATAMGGGVAMNPVGSSGVSGTAEVMAHGEGQTMVMVTLNGPAGASGTHAGHVHTGTCDSPGGVVAPLENVEMTNGTGTASSTVDVPMSTVMNGQHIVVYHEAGGSPGTPVVCGALPAQQM